MSIPRLPDDLGFGSVVTERIRGRFLNKDGTPNSRKYGLGGQAWQRLYLRALAASWPEFLAWTTGLALLLAGIFAVAFRSLGPAALQGTDQLGVADPFFSAFTYSVGILTGVGSGPVFPVGSTANWLTILESIAGLIVLVLGGGLTLARLSRPRAHLRFSQRAVIAPYQGGTGLMFRVVNAELGELSGAEVRVNFVWYEDKAGKKIRGFHELPLERDRVEFFTLHWTVVHPIDANSPLRGVTREALANGKGEFLVLVTAHEETFSTRVTARTSYLYDEVVFDAKFADVFVDSPDGVITVDLDRLDRIERVASAGSPPALKS